MTKIDISSWMAAICSIVEKELATSYEEADDPDDVTEDERKIAK